MYIKQNKPSGKSASDSSAINQFAPRPFKVEDSLAQDIVQAESLDSQKRESSPAPTYRHIPVFSPDKIQPRPASPSLQLKIDPNYQSTIDRVTAQPPVDQSLRLQPKLNIGKPGDKYEQEAERMAKDVVQRIHFTDNQIEENKKQPQLNSPSENSWLSRMSIQQPEYQPLPPPPRVQMKLTIGPPGNQYEQKADRGASEVIQRINALPASAGQSVQCLKNSEEKINPKPEITARLHIEEPERELQAKSIHQRQEAIVAGEASTDLASAINSAKRGGQPLDPSLQQSMGKAMGSDISGVKVHTDTQADQLNRQIQAKAFTTGQDVFFRQGAYQPASREGQELIAHELTHVLQQRGDGRLKRVQRASVTVTTQQADEASAIIANVIWKSRCPTSSAVRDEVKKLNATTKQTWQVGHKIGWEIIATEMGNQFKNKTIQQAFDICKGTEINLSEPTIKNVELGIGIWADKYYRENYPNNEFAEDASSNMSTGGSVTHLRDAYITSPDYGKEKKTDPKAHKKRKLAYANATMKTGIIKPKTKEQKAARQKQLDKIAKAWKQSYPSSPLRETELDDIE